jgi:pimeloyl-ACP methyl ester carboxylesterase
MTSRSITVPLTDDLAVPVSFTEYGTGTPILLLHGGGGPQTVTGWGAALGDTGIGRVIVPVHPGFDGTDRPAALSTVGDLAALYAALLGELALEDVTVVGNSIGGWIAAELAVLGSKRVRGYVLVDAVGIEVPGHPVVDFFSLTPAEIAAHSYHDPARFGLDPAALSPEARERLAANRATLQVYGGTTMVDPSLAGRLAAVDRPTLVLWGDADRIADADYGRALAAAVPGARFELLARTGHLPQIETPDQLTAVVRRFVTE